MNDLFNRFKIDTDLFLEYLKDIINSKEYLSSELKEAIYYSVFRGGKRLRPIFCFGVAKSLNKDIKQIFDFASTIELIHNYSLVHDDLPEMDNDDYRRGLESTHKKFGNAIGLLAGDALLSLSSEVAFLDVKNNFSINKVNAYDLLFKKSGATGMIDGQAFEKDINSIEDYFDVITKKTANLFISSIVGSAIYLNAHSESIDLLYDFSLVLGQTFQLLDDYIDHENDRLFEKFNFDLRTTIDVNSKKLYDFLNLLDNYMDSSYFRYIVDELLSKRYIKNESWYFYKWKF